MEYLTMKNVFSFSGLRALGFVLASVVLAGCTGTLRDSVAENPGGVLAGGFFGAAAAGALCAAAGADPLESVGCAVGGAAAGAVLVPVAVKTFAAEKQVPQGGVFTYNGQQFVVGADGQVQPANTVRASVYAQQQPRLAVQPVQQLQTALPAATGECIRLDDAMITRLTPSGVRVTDCRRLRPERRLPLPAGM
jgi:hypothetical protein